jgi:hypothetical protein
MRRGSADQMTCHAHVIVKRVRLAGAFQELLCQPRPAKLVVRGRLIASGAGRVDNSCRTLESMGSRGGRRKTKRASTPVVLDPTPPIMWPEPGSGFEADPFSPAGTSQQIWRFTQREPHSRVARWIVRAVALLAAIALVASQVIR